MKKNNLSQQLLKIIVYTLEISGLVGLVLIHNGTVDIQSRMLFYGTGALLIFYHFASKYGLLK
ncbi:hypothetical protein LB450_11905 [Psychroflexus sp. CAK1W]|uniref:hypothetical protein n=1 Tax=Psychroflexus curvus TaxID=2873595 RepID=UPI001CCB410C|nr:hypothetical protein [Psychroflexus curvus]MBZ9628808.1 hypothetical protein [Psychroflexus curvus]